MKPYISRWFPVLIWSLVIFLASANPDPTKPLPPRWSEPCFSSEFSSPSCAELLGRVLHTAEYAILAALTARAMIWKKDFRFSTLIIVLVFAELYALTDEIHQLFVPGRNFQWMDLGLDLLGIMIGLLFYATCRKKHDKSLLGRVRK